MALAAEQELPAPHLHYTMDDVAGAVVPDASGNNLDGAISGTTSVVDAEGGGTALDLPGGPDGGYVTIPRAALEGATHVTVSARVGLLPRPQPVRVRSPSRNVPLLS